MWKYSLFYYNKCDIVTCPSAFTKRELISKGCKPPVKFISNGVDVDEFEAGEIDIKAEYQCKGPLLLSVSRVSVEKNIRHMLDAMKHIVIRGETGTKLYP